MPEGAGNFFSRCVDYARRCRLDLTIQVKKLSEEGDPINGRKREER